MRRPIVAGNWKMHLTRQEAHALARQLTTSCQPGAVDVVVCPPFTALAAVETALRGSHIALGAQDLFWEPEGAFTGEISPAMLVDAGCRYVIVGHSERRTFFGETDDAVHRKLTAALQHGLTPIVCIGETLAQRERHETFDVLTHQLAAAFADAEQWGAASVVLAYEPVWAIGTGKTATTEQAQEAHQFIRQWVAKRRGPQVSESLCIQYGGSVTAANAASLLQQSDVDGALVGGASLKAEAFATIVKAALEAKPSVGQVRTVR